tara:strand:+ start:40 stop:849 length:810 start_codon:yes stop_codon:yes gene_type:complete
MPTFRGNTFANFFNRILQIDQSSNSNVDSTTRSVQSGGGTNTSISLSDDQLLVKPQTDDTTSTLDVKTSGGTSILTADTTNKRILCGSGQVNALTQYKEFSCVNLAPTAGYHRVLASKGDVFHNTDAIEALSLGNGDDPATTFDISADIDTTNIVPLYWYLPDAITVVAVHVLAGGSTASTSPDLNFQLYSYAMDTSSNHGDLSDGTLVAGTVGATGSFITDIHEDLIKYQSLANCPTDVAAGRVILATVESTGSNVISVNMVVKYHIQ